MNDHKTLTIEKVPVDRGSIMPCAGCMFLNIKKNRCALKEDVTGFFECRDVFNAKDYIFIIKQA